MWHDLRSLSMRWALGLAALSSLGACSSNKPELPQQDIAGIAEAPQDPEPAAAKPPQGSFSLQEWGLFTYSAQGALLRSGPGVKDETDTSTKPIIEDQPRPQPIERPPMPMKKPVIYLKPDAAWSEATPISVEVKFQGTGRFREVWPTPNNGAQPPASSSFKWENIKLQAKACEAGWGPKADSPACKSLMDGDECEGAQLERWVPQTPRCLDVNGIPAGALVYNGAPQELNAPLEQTSPGVWKNTSAHALGALLIQHKGKRYALKGLAAGAQWSVNDQNMPAEVVQDAKAWVLAQLGAQGLGEQESEDFMRAWSVAIDDKSAWAVFGLFDGAAIERFVKLEVNPKPTSVTRVLALMVAADKLALRPNALDSSLDVKAVASQDPTACEPYKAPVVLNHGKPQVQGQLKPLEIARIMMREGNKLTPCYDALLRKSPHAQVNLTLKMVIASSGEVMNAAVESALRGDASARQCVADAARQFVFPAHQGAGVAIIRHPMSFSLKSV